MKKLCISCVRRQCEKVLVWESENLGSHPVFVINQPGGTYNLERLRFPYP